MKLEGTNLYWENGVFMGEVLRDIDGYYKWWPVSRGGYLDEGALRLIANFLRDLNKEWNVQVVQKLGDSNAPRT